MKSARRGNSVCSRRASSWSARAASARRCSFISPRQVSGRSASPTPTGSIVGALKVDSARDALASINPGVRVETHPLRLGPENAEALIGGYGLVADGSDNFDTRYLLTDLCFRLKKPLVAAALSPFEGQISTFKPYLGAGHPCYRCLFRDPPPPDLVPRCETAGILGAVAGVLGTLQAVETLKELLQLGESLDGTLLLYDALRARFHSIRIAKDPECPTCGRP